MADTNPIERTTVTPLANVFFELDADLECEAKDLEWTMANVSAKDDLHQWTPHRRELPSRIQHFCESNSTDPEQHIFLLDIIPDCLLASNSSFAVAFFYLLHDHYNPVDPVPLEQLAILTYKMSIIYLHQQLWRVYLHSGTGQLRSLVEFCGQERIVPPRVWPLQVSELLIAHGSTHTKHVHEIDHRMHTDFVQNYLSMLSGQHQRYRTQFDTIRSQLDYFTDALGYHMERYVLKNALVTAQLLFDTRMVVVKHAYTDRWLQLEFLQQKPNEDQIQLANHICQLTFAAEKTREEHVLFKTGVFYKKLPRSFHLLDVSLPASIEIIQEAAVRDGLSQDYRRVIDRANFDLTNVLTSACEAAKLDCEKTLNVALEDIWHGQHRLPNDARLPSALLSLIEQRQKNIKTCVTQVFSLKSDFLIQIPTVAAIRD